MTSCGCCGAAAAYWSNAQGGRRSRNSGHHQVKLVVVIERHVVIEIVMQASISWTTGIDDWTSNKALTNIPLLLAGLCCSLHATPPPTASWLATHAGCPSLTTCLSSWSGRTTGQPRWPRSATMGHKCKRLLCGRTPPTQRVALSQADQKTRPSCKFQTRNAGRALCANDLQLTARARVLHMGCLVAQHHANSALVP